MTTHFNPMPRLRTRGVIPPLYHTSSCRGVQFTIKTALSIPSTRIISASNSSFENPELYGGNALATPSLLDAGAIAHEVDGLFLTSDSSRVQTPDAALLAIPVHMRQHF
jgi:hypothetical protein